MALDQGHEQNNAIIKGDGGVIGLTEDPSALRRWMVAGPETSRMVANFEKALEIDDDKANNLHHEQTPAAQKIFLEKVQRLTTVIDELGNPFAEETGDLLVLDSKNIADSEGVNLVATHLERGRDQYNTFISDLQKNPSSLYNSIKRNCTDFFKQRPKSTLPSETKILKDDRQLFS